MSKRIIFILTSALLLIAYGCQREEIVNTSVVSASGLFVLYEGGFTPGSGDYAFINLTNDSVYSSVYRNSNNGAYLNLFPDGMLLYLNQDLYVTAQGNYNGPGTIYKINSQTNQLISSANFGNNPYNLCVAAGNIYVTNISGSSVTRLDLNLNVVRTISVGPNPADLIYALGRVYVTKASYTNENSLDIIDIYTNQVSRIYFNAVPLSAANNTGGVYVSDYTTKKIYVLDSLVAAQVNDSINLASFPVFTNDGVGDIISGNPRTLYIVGLDTVQFANIGKKVYKYDIFTRALSLLIEDAELANAYGISYEPESERIYIADDNGGNSSGEVRVYNNLGQFIKSYSIGGYFPRRLAFKYIQTD